MEQRIDFTVGPLQVHVFRSLTELGEDAAERAAAALRRKIKQHGRARIVLSAADSQLPVSTALAAASDVDWTRVEAFHVDEYVGLPATHPASFRRWVVEHFAERVKPGKVNYLAGDAADVDAELRRYAGLLSSAPIDVALLGFGENGHIGFNDPQEADFNDPLAVRRVRLDRRCRLQQVGEGHFPNLETVPEDALTLTCPALVGAEEIVCCAPDSRKAEAVHNALEGRSRQAARDPSCGRTAALMCIWTTRRRPCWLGPPHAELRSDLGAGVVAHRAAVQAQARI